MNEIKMSVIIPVYNGESFIEDGLASILAQTLTEIEIIIINDCSTDKTLEVLEKYKKQSNIKIINNKKNLGLGVSRNKGIELASGQYVHFFDADDLVEDKDFYKNLYECGINNNLDIIFCSCHIKKFENKKLIRTVFFRYPKNKVLLTNKEKEFVLSHGVTAWNKIFKLNLLLKENIKFPSYPISEDVYFHWISIVKASRIMYSPQNFYTYMNRSDSLMRQKFDYKRFELIIEVFEAVKEFLITNNYFSIYEKTFVLFYLKKYCGIYKFSKFDNKKIFHKLSKKVQWVQLSKYNFPLKYMKFKALIANRYYLFNLLNLDFKKIFNPK